MTHVYTAVHVYTKFSTHSCKITCTGLRPFEIYLVFAYAAPLGGRKLQTLQPLAFDEYCRFDIAAIFGHTGEASLALYAYAQRKVLKVSPHVAQTARIRDCWDHPVGSSDGFKNKVVHVILVVSLRFLIYRH